MCICNAAEGWRRTRYTRERAPAVHLGEALKFMQVAGIVAQNARRSQIVNVKVFEDATSVTSHADIAQGRL